MTKTETPPRHLQAVDGRETLGEDRAKSTSTAQPSARATARHAEAIAIAKSVRQRKKRPAETVEPPVASAADFIALQQALADREIVGFKQPLSRGKFCDRVVVLSDEGGENMREAACSGHAAFQVVDETMCPSCEKMDTEVLLQFCVSDAALWATDQIKVDPQLGLFAAANDGE